MSINGRVLDGSERLQKILGQIDPQKDRETLVWAHGFLSGLIQRIETGLPNLLDTGSLQQRVTEAAERLKENVSQRRFNRMEPDSLDEIERTLGEEEPGDAPVPRKAEAGSKGSQWWRRAAVSRSDRHSDVKRGANQPVECILPSRRSRRADDAQSQASHGNMPCRVAVVQPNGPFCLTEDHVCRGRSERARLPKASTCGT
jgi:hypothetical protein